MDGLNAPEKSIRGGATTCKDNYLQGQLLARTGTRFIGIRFIDAWPLQTQHFEHEYQDLLAKHRQRPKRAT